jgi:asparagine synthetase B (glutamine-hydrolysing)
VKPLYIANDGRRLIFASEAKSILQVPGVSTALDHDALASYLSLGYVPAPQSIFRGVRGMWTGLESSGLIDHRLVALLNRRVAALNGCEF